MRGEPKSKGTGRAVVLLSGGMDSAVALALAIREGLEAFALTVRYGQRHAVEIEAARLVASALGAAEHKVLDVGLSAFGGSSLVGDGSGPVAGDEGAIPTTYVPARNAVLLSLGLAWAEAIGARDVFIGVSSVDYSGYPDCRPEFVESFERTANLGTLAAEGGPRFRIRAPLMRLSKAETVRIGLESGVDFSLTRSCYSPDASGAPCGECASCMLRARGFEEAGVADPLVET